MRTDKMVIWAVVFSMSIGHCVWSQTIAVQSHQKISDTEGGFAGNLIDNNRFGRSITKLEDFNGDGVTEIAIGTQQAGWVGPGSVWILFMNSDGTVENEVEIGDGIGGLPLDLLDTEDYFGCGVTSIGDVNGDGVVDIAVGAYGDDDGGSSNQSDYGAVWIIFLNDNGAAESYQKISALHGGFTGTLGYQNHFGMDVASLGDLDGDGVPDILVGERDGDDGGTSRGAVWILFLNSNGTVKSHQKISSTQGNFTGVLDNGDGFGGVVASLGYVNDDDVIDIAVSAESDDDGGNMRGAVWILFLNDDGTVKGHQKISDTEGNFTGVLHDGYEFGTRGIAGVEDLDGDSVPDMVVGGRFDSDGGANRGAVWILFLNDNGTVKCHQKISDIEGNFLGTLDDNDQFGSSIASIGDLNGDNISDLAVGAMFDDDGGLSRGAVWILFLEGPEVILDAIIDINPDTLNIKSHGQYVTAYITLPDGYDVGEIDATTIAITSLLGTSCDPEYTQSADLISFVPQVGDRDEDGILDLTVKFDRQVLILNLCLDDVEIVIEGDLNNGVHFTGKDKIRVIDRGK